MKFQNSHGYSLLKRVASVVAALAMLSMDIPLNPIVDNIDFGGLVSITAKATGEYDTTKFTDIGNMTLSLSDFAEYSRCYANVESFASAHQNDVIKLNPTGYWKLLSGGDDPYVPLGTSKYPFMGTIRVNELSGGSNFLLLMDAPLFNVVYDSAKLYSASSTDAVELEFIRTDSNENPIFANEVRHDENHTSATWKVVLSDQTKQETNDGIQTTYGNFNPYGGVIGKMMSGAELELEFTDNSTASQGAYVKRSTAQGTLCGEMAEGSSLVAKYVNSTSRSMQVGDGSDIDSGGFVGTMTGASFTLKTGSTGINFAVSSGNKKAGLIAGDVKKGETDESLITIADGLSFSGSVTGTSGYVGGLVGSLVNSDINVGTTGTGSLTLSGVTVSGTNKTGGAIGYFEPTANNSNALTNITYNMTNCTIGGTNPGGVLGEYKSVGSESVDVGKFVFSGTTFNSGSAGGVFGVYTANGDTTITGTFSAPQSSVSYGGVIGQYSNSDLTRTLSLSSLTVTGLNQTSDTQNLGGVILNVTGSSYISVNGVSVTVAGGANKCSTDHPFGGIVSTIGASAATGSFIDLTGNFTLTVSGDGATYKGGAIAGSFKNGVLRLAGTTDLSGAKTENGYGQLIYENDTTLVYSKGTGKDSSTWMFKRNASTTASDLGQWGEVVRFSNMETDIVTVSGHTVTLKAISTSVSDGKTTASISDKTGFAKLALNMQLNNGTDHGALKFETTNASPKSSLLGASITVNGEIDLTGTGLLGLTRDGGNGKYLDAGDNSFKGNPDFFTGSITGASNAEIKLAVGEAYGCDASGNALSATDNGGCIYLSHNYGHDAQGLIAFGKGATLSTIKISGTMRVRRVTGSDYLYVAPVFGAMTNGATLTSVTVTTAMAVDKANNSRFYIGGVAGVFDGTDTGAKTLSVTSSSITPSITLNGTVACETDHDHTKNNVYAGGVLGLLKGATATLYKVSLTSTAISPTISMGSNVADTTESFVGGVIGYVCENSSNEREITFDTVSMTSASIEQKSQHSGGLLGSYWDRTKVTIDGLTITGSSVNNTASTANALSGLVYRATGNWSVNALSISSTNFSAKSAAHTSFGLIVNQAYHGNDGLYLNLKNAGYVLSSVTIPTSTSASYYVDEIVANTASSADKVVSGGNGVGIVNINMNAANGTVTKLTDTKNSENTVTESGTGTYQNKVLSNNKLIANQNARYYYNLDVIKAKESPTDGEQFLMWSIYNHYAPSNIQGYSVITNPAIAELTDVDLRGLSYYPINVASVTLPAATFTFGYEEIKTLEAAKGTDDWERYPASTGDMTTTDNKRRNQHYLMQNGLFQNVTGTLNSSDGITFAGDFGGVGNAGVLIGGTLTGNVNLSKGVTLKNFKPSSSDYPMLVNYINGTASDVNPQFTLKGLRLEDYPSSDTAAVASALIYNAEGTGMKLIFSDIKLDARDGNAISDSHWTTAAANAMTNAYGTSRSIFKDATLFRSLKSNSSDTIEYYYSWNEDWGTEKVNDVDVTKRNVTYGKEVNVGTTTAYPYYYKDEDPVEGTGIARSGERRYSGTKIQFTNPVDSSDTQFDFSSGFLPYVKNRNTDTTFNISEVKVNFVSTGLVEGCGTYNDPYIITSSSLMTKVAEYINSSNAVLGTICLPATLNATWHTSDALYHKADSTKGETASRYYLDDGETGINTWTYEVTREYLAGAYYVIPDDLTLPATFPGIGKGGASENGKTVFHGVIVGRQKENSEDYPTITNLSNNPFIYISNGSVIKNLNFSVSSTSQSAIEISQANAGSGANYTFNYNDITNSSNKTAKYYGGVFGEIMGGDNIIDGVAVEYTNRPIKLTGNNKQLIACGGFVGAIVNGGLIFRGANSVTGFTAYDNDLSTDALAASHTATLYANPYVGRVINGYAVNEGTSTLNNTTKHYTIDSITPPTAETSKLDVTGSTITIPNAQSLFIMSLITQSTAGTAVSASGDYGVSQSYGINSNVFCGSNHLGTYADVGKKHTVDGKEVIYTASSDIPDYSNKAINDVANATDATRKTAVPYIISAYTKAYSGTYPARTITYDSSKFWDISLNENGSFDLSVYPSFRGIGCMGNKNAAYSMKVSSFNGNGNIITLSILETRYGMYAENYFHLENYSTTPTFQGHNTNDANYGHDNYLQKLFGLGLFDSVNVKNDSTHPYQFFDFTLKGNIKEIVYSSTGADITGKKEDQVNKKGQSQLFCIGGVVGKRISTETVSGYASGGYESDLNFKDIKFDGLTISGAYSCGGLIGIDALKKETEMHIVNCNSTANGVNITGGYYGYDNALRHGIGSFVGMTFLCRPIINGDDSETSEIEKSDIFVANVDSQYNGTDNRCNVGGLIGYSGTGAEIKNINLLAANANAVIGSDKAANASGLIAFGQTGSSDNMKSSIYIENCTIQNVSVKARNSASGFYGRCNNESYGPKYIYISDCAIIGNGNVEIKAYGTGTTDNANYAGGMLACSNATSRTDNTIQNSYISGYKIEGYYVGGMIGRIVNKSVNLKNVYVKDCSINTYKDAEGYAGGFVGYTAQNLNGYNMKIEDVNFKLRNNSDNTGKAGAFVGNAGGKNITFIAIAKYYNTDVSKVPIADIIAGTGGSNLLVFADYTGQSQTPGNTNNVSSFGKTAYGGNITEQNKAPYLTLNPSSAMGSNEFISGDGAYQLSTALTGYETYTSGKSAAARVYADYSATSNKSNRAYSLTMESPITDVSTAVSLDTYFKQSSASGKFKVSTWNTEMATKAGVDDFTVLVVNNANDPESTTNLIDNYIRLMTGTSNHYMADVAGKYHIAITPCRYVSGKFVLQSSVTPGLIKNGTANVRNNVDGKQYKNGYYQMDLNNADSKYDDQFTLIDVQFFDPTDTAANASKHIAYHLYVPVLTKKTVNIEFSAASISGSEYNAGDYIERIANEIANNKSANDPTTLVDSMEVWNTTYLKFSYPADQVNELLKLGSNLKWNHDKQINIVWTRESNLPNSTKMLLIDPNNNADKAYYSTLESFTSSDRTRVIDLSKFTARANGTGAKFHEQTLYSLLYDNKLSVQTNSAGKGAYNEVQTQTTNSLAFKINDTIRYFELAGSSGAVDLIVEEPLVECYYLSLYVPKTEGQADVVQIQPVGTLGTVNEAGTGEATGNVIRATVSSKLNAALIIGDFYTHEIKSFSLTSKQNSSIISDANKELTAITTVDIQLVNSTEGQAYYFATTLGDSSINLYHSFNLQLICNTTLDSSTDIIQGIENNDITATYKINNGQEQTLSGNNIIRETSYIQCTTGDIKTELINAENNYKVTIVGKAVMNFADFTDEFPPNSDEIDGIGVQGATRSNLAYHTKDLPYSKMNDKTDPSGMYFYTADNNSALFSFDAVDEIDEEKIGSKTQNNSKLGVNDHFTYNNTIYGKAVYNAADVKDFENSTSIEYTLELFRKTTTNGITEYKQVNIPDYITNVSLVDAEVPETEENLSMEEQEITLGDGTKVKKYVYTRNLKRDNETVTGIDADAMFFADFRCKVLKDEEYAKKDYANYKIRLTVRLHGSSNNERTSSIIYTNAKIDPTMIEAPVANG